MFYCLPDVCPQFYKCIHVITKGEKMSKKLFLIMLAVCALTFAAAQTSPTNTATRYLFSDEIDQSFSVTDWSEADVGDGMWFLLSGGLPGIGAAGYTDGGTFLAGYADASIPDYSKTDSPDVEKSSLSSGSLTLRGLVGFGKDSTPFGLSLYGTYSGRNSPETKPYKVTSYTSDLTGSVSAGMKIGGFKPSVTFSYQDYTSVKEDENPAHTSYDNSYTYVTGIVSLAYLTEEKNSFQHQFSLSAQLSEKTVADESKFTNGTSSANGSFFNGNAAYTLFYKPASSMTLAVAPSCTVTQDDRELFSYSYYSLYINPYVNFGVTFSPSKRFTANGGFKLSLPSYSNDVLVNASGKTDSSGISTLSGFVSGGIAFNLTDNVKLDASVYHSGSSASASLAVIIKK